MTTEPTPPDTVEIDRWADDGGAHPPDDEEDVDADHAAPSTPPFVAGGKRRL